MKNEQKQLIELLNYSLGFSDKVNKVDFLWNSIFEESKEHSISSLIYYGITKLELNSYIDKNILEQWKKNAMLLSIEDLRHTNELEKIVSEFINKNISIMVLKGIVLKDLYPRNEFRTMGDYDLLVKEDNLNEAMIIMENLGYNLENEGADEHGAHKAYVKVGFRKVEIHWTLINDDYFTGTKEFERELWVSAENFKVGNSIVKKLDHENMVLHLIVHMAVHIICSGFGLRQLSDLALYIKAYEGKIDWDTLLKMANETGVAKFLEALVLCCNKLFNINVPFELKYFNINDAIIDELIATIFENGVFGRKDMGLIFKNQLAFSKKEEVSEINNIIRILCPRAEDMNDKYNYAKKNKVLLPIAWGHHICRGIARKDLSIRNKVDFLTKTVKVAKKRRKMYDELDLS